MGILGIRVGPRLDSRGRNPTISPGVTPEIRTYPWKVILVGLAIALAILLVAATQGSVRIPFDAVAKIVLSRIPWVTIDQTWPQSWDTIIWQLRLPRVVVAALVGLALGLSGATYQGLFRNPLADPYLIGVAAGAGLGAVLILLTPLASYAYGVNLVPIAALLGALAAVSIAYVLARGGGTVPTTTLILAGVAVGSFAAAITTFLLMTSSKDIRPVLTWLLGSFSTASWRNALVILPYLLPSALVILAHGRILNVLQLDEEEAQQLGINVERTKVILVLAASLATAAAVSVSGLIGFVGLVAPHAVRLVWGADHRLLLPMSAIVGAAFLVLADMGARTLLNPTELPVGVITAFIGAPFFLYLLRKGKRAIL